MVRCALIQSVAEMMISWRVSGPTLTRTTADTMQMAFGCMVLLAVRRADLAAVMHQAVHTMQQTFGCMVTTALQVADLAMEVFRSLEGQHGI